MKTRIKLFLTSPEYRWLCLEGIKTGIAGFFLKLAQPFINWYETIQFKKTYPDRWERYVAVKRREEQNNELKKFEEYTMQRMTLTHSITRMIISMLAFVDMKISVDNGGEADDAKYEGLEADFAQQKEAALGAIKTLKELDAIVPDEFETAIVLLEINQFDTFKDVQSLSEALRDFDRRIEYGKE